MKDMIYHILPVNDLKDHIDKSTCECIPTVKVIETGDMIVIHNSYDGREIVEEVNNILQHGTR